MTNTKFTAFIDLIQFDQETMNLNKKVAQLTRELDSLQEQQKNLTGQLETMHDALFSARKEVDAKELEMKELDQQEKEQKKRLDKAKNEKEYRSSKAEIEMLKSKQTELEVQLVGVWHKLEQAEKGHTKQKEEVEKEHAALQVGLKETQEALVQTNKDIERQTKERKEKSAGVPEEWLEQYASMADRVTDPAVPVEQESCSACFHMLSSEDMILLSRNKLLQCKGCYRFLYLPEPVKESKEEESA